MKKNKTFGLCVLAAATVLGLGACNQGGTTASSSSSSEVSSESVSVHTHTSDGVWHYDEEQHWHECAEDGEKLDVAEHTFTETVVDPTDEENGYTLHSCECGYSYKDNETVKTYALGFNGGDYAFAIGLPEKAKKGETISFKVTVESGYEVTGVTAKAGENEITLDGTLASGFTFTMPGEAVQIEVATDGAYFKAQGTSEGDEGVVLQPEAATASAKKIADFIYGYIVDGEKIVGQSLYARAGKEVAVLTNYVAIADNVKYSIGDVELTPDTYEWVEGEGESAKTYTYSVVRFTMPNHSVDIKVSAEERTYQLAVDAPDYVVASLYKLDSDGNKVDVTDGVKGNGSDKVYLSLAFDGDHDNGNYKIDSVQVVYKQRSGFQISENYTEATSSAFETSSGSGVYYYTVSTFTSYYGPITFKVNVAEAVYGEEEWVGTFGGTEIYGSSIIYSSSTTMTATAFGNVNMGGSYGSSRYVREVQTVPTAKRVSLANSSSSVDTEASYFFYDGGVAVAPFNLNKSTTDYYILVKDKTKNDITYTYDEGGTVGGVLFVKMADSEGNSLGNVLSMNGTYYLNVDVEFEDGYTAVNSSSHFTVKKGGDVIATYPSEE